MDELCPLHVAVRDSDLEKIKALLNDNPALAFSTDAFGWTALHWAAEAGKKDVVELLLASKPEMVNAKDDDYGATPLHYAAGKGRQDVVELLLAIGADVNATDKGWSTPLHYAARWGSKAVADLLLVNDAELNAKDREGHTPLHYAARDNTDVAELLRQHGGHE